MIGYSLDLPFRMPWIFPTILIGLGMAFMAHAFWITWTERTDS